MTSKFANSAKQKKAPAYCIPGPSVPIPGFIGTAPSWLVAYATWNDWMPEPGTWVSEILQLNLISDEPAWLGHAPNWYPRLELLVKLETPPDKFLITLWLYRSADDLEDFRWHNIQPPSLQDFKLTPPDDVVVPQKDYRSVAVYG